MTNYERKLLELNEYLKKKGIKGTVTFIQVYGFNYMLDNGTEWYMPYDEM